MFQRLKDAFANKIASALMSKAEALAASLDKAVESGDQAAYQRIKSNLSPVEKTVLLSQLRSRHVDKGDLSGVANILAWDETEKPGDSVDRVIIRAVQVNQTAIVEYCLDTYPSAKATAVEALGMISSKKDDPAFSGMFDMLKKHGIELAKSDATAPSAPPRTPGNPTV